MIFEYKAELGSIPPEVAEPDWMRSEHDTTFTVVAANIRFYLFPVNRIDDFFKYIWHGRGVHRLEIENQLDIYAKADEEIHFEY